MGKSRSYEIKEYRQKIIDILCDSKEICNLLGVEPDNAYKEIPFHKCFPFEYVPEAQTQSEGYINFEISASINKRNNLFKDVTIYFFIFCRKDVVRYNDDIRDNEDNDNIDLWYDDVVCVLDSIFNERKVEDWTAFGLPGTMVLESNIPYTPQEKFRGRLLKFTVQDFSNGKKYGLPLK